MQTTTTYPQVLGASTIVGSAVRNPAGEDLGKIHEVMINLERGSVAYAVLTFGGFLGLGNKLFALPWRALRRDSANGAFILNVSKERLKQAPGFESEQWPNMEDSVWESSIHKFYGMTP